MRACKEVLHKFQFFLELLYDGVCGVEFVERSLAPLEGRKRTGKKEEGNATPKMFG